MFKVLNEQHSLEPLMQGLTAGYKVHSSYGELDGPAFSKMQDTMFKAFPDSKFEVQSIVVEGDMVGVNYTVSATHKGKLPGIPATRKKVRYMVMAFHRLEGGKTAESWLLSDAFGLLEQLGAIPPAK